MRHLTFTFDNGPVPGATERVLDFLADHSIKATFFVIGNRLQAVEARRVAERAKAEGHWIGNHTFSHAEPLGIEGDATGVGLEIGHMQELLDSLSHPSKLFRPNGNGRLGPHLLSPAALSYLCEHRFTLVTWNNVPRDWEVPHTAWVGRALASLANTSWSLLVLHDEHVVEMMDTLIDFHKRALAMGVEIVQDFPASCVPIREGKITGSVNGLVAAKPTNSLPPATGLGA